MLRITNFVIDLKYLYSIIIFKFTSQNLIAESISKK